MPTLPIDVSSLAGPSIRAEHRYDDTSDHHRHATYRKKTPPNEASKPNPFVQARRRLERRQPREDEHEQYAGRKVDAQPPHVTGVGFALSFGLKRISRASIKMTNGTSVLRVTL